MSEAARHRRGHRPEKPGERLKDPRRAEARAEDGVRGGIANDANERCHPALVRRFEHHLVHQYLAELRLDESDLDRGQFGLRCADLLDQIKDAGLVAEFNQLDNKPAALR